MSLIKSLLESENAILDNNKISSVLNELSSIQEKNNFLNKKIMYTAESVPVFKIIQNNNPLLVVEYENLYKLMQSQSIDSITALDNIKSILSSDDNDVNFDDMALLVKDEDIERIEELCKSDNKKIGARSESIVSYNNLLKEIISEGVTILVNKL